MLGKGLESLIPPSQGNDNLQQDVAGAEVKPEPVLAAETSAISPSLGAVSPTLSEPLKKTKDNHQQIGRAHV